jgi:site-specific DNA recombinase
MNIALYVRVSTQRQAQTQTIEQQLHLLREYMLKQGWEWKEESIFRDDGYSGASLRRPRLDRLRDQVRNAAFDRVLITEPSRLHASMCIRCSSSRSSSEEGARSSFWTNP